MSKKTAEQFTVMERIMLINNLPTQGNFQDLKILRKLREALSFNETEHEKLQFQSVWQCNKCSVNIASPIQPKCPKCSEFMKTGDQVVWNPDAAVKINKTLNLGNRAKQIITESLFKLSNDGNLPDQLLPLYQRFVGDEDSDDEEIEEVNEDND
jgi:hypothetical protein